MERLKSNDHLLKQMEAFNFDDPFKVTRYFEDEEDKLDDLTETIFEKSIPCTTNKNNLKRKHTKTMKEVYFTNVFQNAVEKSLDSEHEYPMKAKNTINVHSIQEKNFAAICRDECHLIQTQKSQGKEQRFSRNDYNFQSSSDVISTMDTKRILNLLDKISSNLIEISKCYYYTLVAPTDSRTRSAREAHYLNFKQQYFNYSYYMVDAIFLPQENNRNFIEKYIKRTFNLAHRESWYFMSKNYLLHLILDIINWTKKKKQYLENTGAVENQITTPLNERTTASNSCNIIIDTNRPTISTCHFSSSSQRGQITKNGQSNILQDVLSPSDLENLPIKRRKTYDGFNHFVIKQFDNVEQTSMQRPNNIISSYRHQTNFPINNLRQNEGKQNKNLNAENQYRILRTVSRDSGYLSPDIGVLAPGDQTEKVSSSLEIPSTNSVACPLPIIVCKVCSTVTRNVCLGCNRIYYCSLNCQKKDWPSHKIQCRK